MNNPSFSNEQKEIFGQKMDEQQSQQQSQQQRLDQSQILNLQLYNPRPPRPEKPAIQPISFFPSFATNPMFPPHLANMMPPWTSGFGYPTINVNKIYDINVNGPADTHHRLNMIYEDVLPTKHIKTTFNSLGDRLTQSNYIRTVLFPNGDGDEVGFTGESRNSLLSHIKFLDLNPYNTYRFSDNPYKGLPDDFLIYRSCYPIQRNERDGMTMCSRNSMAVNLRIYKLTVGAYKINKQNKTAYTDYPQWRDVAFYEYVREFIIKKKVCPNFVTMHGFYTCENSSIDFNKVNILKTYKPDKRVSYNETTFLHDYLQKNIQKQKTPKEIEQDKIREELAQRMRDNYGTINARLLNIPPQQMPPVPKPLMMPSIKGAKLANQSSKEPCEDLDAYTGSVLAVMTESPTYNMYNWASKLYQLEGNTKRMINTGFHTDAVWIGLIFQLMVAMLVMQINDIYIDNFSIRNNVFIKDLSSDANVTNYWKYKINNIEYYIPNHGHLLLIDSNFADIVDTQQPQFIGPVNKTFKLNGKIYDSSMNVVDIKQKCFEAFKNAMDPNNFKGDFVSEGGTAPQQETLQLLETIHSEANTSADININTYIIKYMRRFMNNRIGTYLKETEYPHVRPDDMRNAKPGEIVVLDEGNGNNRFVLLLKVDNGVASVISKNDALTDMIDKDYPINSLLNYSRHEPIVQNYKANEANLTEEAIIETYNIIF
jgi:hypothetical protein